MTSIKRSSIFERTPWWLLIASILGVLFLWQLTSTEQYRVIFLALTKGIWVTIWVSLTAFALAAILGMFIVLLRIHRLRVLREIATFYIEVVRGIPMLVLLFYIAFVSAPALVGIGNTLFTLPIELGWMSKFTVRDFDFTWRAIFALMIGYSAFIAEIFRAGIEAVNNGQTEAARALGLSRWQTFRHVVWPQAFRTILPPLGNDFVAMIKDSALVSALGVQDITQLGKVYSSSTFLFFETYNVVAFLYLVMTMLLALIVKWLEFALKNRP